MTEPTIQACALIIDQATKTTRRLVQAMLDANLINAQYAEMLDSHLATVQAASEDLVDATHASQGRGRESPEA